MKGCGGTCFQWQSSQSSQAGLANPGLLEKGINQIELYWLKLQFHHKVLFGPIILKKKKKPILDSTKQKHNKTEHGSFGVKVNGIIDKGHPGLFCQLRVPKG